MELVFCLIKNKYVEIDDDELLLDLDPFSKLYKKKELIIPLYNHPHNDVENGQKEIHYHQNNKYEYNILDLLEIKSYKFGRIKYPLIDGEYFGYRLLNKISDVERMSTDVNLIKKSKLKYNCIHKGKCPHRGYDLSNEKAINGVITCPLHSLKFNSITKNIIK